MCGVASVYRVRVVIATSRCLCLLCLVRLVSYHCYCIRVFVPEVLTYYGTTTPSSARHCTWDHRAPGGVWWAKMQEAVASMAISAACLHLRAASAELDSSNQTPYTH